MTDGMAAVWTTLTGAVPGVDTEPGPDAAVVTFRKEVLRNRRGETVLIDPDDPEDVARWRA